MKIFFFIYSLFANIYFFQMVNVSVTLLLYTINVKVVLYIQVLKVSLWLLLLKITP